MLRVYWHDLKFYLLSRGKHFTVKLHSSEEYVVITLILRVIYFQPLYSLFVHLFRPLANSAKLLWQSQESLSDQINELEITDSDDDNSSQDDSEWRKSFIETIMEIESNGGLIESDYTRNPFLVVPENSVKKDELSYEASCSSQYDLLTRSRREQNSSIIRDSPNNPFLSPPAVIKGGSNNKVNEYQFAQVL